MRPWPCSTSIGSSAGRCGRPAPGRGRQSPAGAAVGDVTTPTTIAFVDATLAAVLAAIVSVQLNMHTAPVAGVGILTFLVAGAALAFFGYRSQAMAHLYAESNNQQEGPQ